MQKIKVSWLDSVHQGGWTFYKEYNQKAFDTFNECLVKTTGWLLDENEHAYWITSSLGTRDDCLGWVIIPKCAVVKVKITGKKDE